MFEALIAAGERLGRTAGLRAVVLTGAGRGFCAGLDKETFRRDGGRAAQGGARRSHDAHPWNRQRLAAGRLCLAHPVRSGDRGDPGVALGGGFQIALGADIRYVAPDARLSILEVKWGLVPDMSGVALMRELARSDVIRELAMTGRVFSGAEALAYGFATGLHADPLAAARATAKEIAARSPDAVRAIKRLLNRASDDDAASDPPRGIEGAGGGDRLAESDRGGAGGGGKQAGAVRGWRVRGARNARAVAAHQVEKVASTLLRKAARRSGRV